MNKKIGIIVSTLIGAAVLGLGMYQSNASQAEPKLTEEDIRQMVTDQYPGEITELELDQERNRTVYEVEVAGENREYDMELDGNTGEVLEIREKEVVSTSSNSDEDKVNIEERDDGASESVEQDRNQSTEQSDILTIEQIEEIALNEFPGVITELEFDKDDGWLMYEVEIKNENWEEADLDIDAYTGEILKMELEYKNPDTNKGNIDFPDDILSITEIKDIALNEFSGTIKEIELDKDNGRLKYEVDVRNNGQEAEMDVDARTGEILELEIDDD